MIIFSPTDCTDLHRFIPADHNPFKIRANQSSPLQGEIEGVGNMAHSENGVIEYLNVLYILQMLPECFSGLSLYIFSDWHIVPMLKIQIKP